MITFHLLPRAGSPGSSQPSQKCRSFTSVKRSWTGVFFGFRTFLRNSTIGFFEEEGKSGLTSTGGFGGGAPCRSCTSCATPWAGEEPPRGEMSSSRRPVPSKSAILTGDVPAADVKRTLEGPSGSSHKQASPDDAGAEDSITWRPLGVPIRRLLRAFRPLLAAFISTCFVKRIMSS